MQLRETPKKDRQRLFQQFVHTVRWDESAQGPKGADLRLIQGGKGPPNSEAVRHVLVELILA